MSAPLYMGLLATLACGCLSEPTAADANTLLAIDAASIDAASIDAASVDAITNDAIATDAITNDAVASPNTHAMSFLGFGSNFFFIFANDTNTVDLDRSVTFETWFKLIGVPGTGESVALLVKSDDSAPEFQNYGFTLENTAEGLMIVGTIYGTTSTGDAAQDAVGFVWDGLAVGQWHHVAITYDVATPTSLATLANRFHFYTDGTPVLAPSVRVLSTDEPIAVIRKNAAVDVIVGARVTNAIVGSNFHGLLDDIRLWSIVRSDAAIAFTYNTELTGGDAGLLGYWPLDNDTLAATADRSGNDNRLRVLGEITSVKDHAF